MTTGITIVTGSNTGIGKVTATTLARRGHRVVLACRSEEKTLPVVEEIRAAGGQAEFLALDLADLDQVAKAAASLVQKGEPIRVLVNNAGLAGSQGSTAQGFELTFGVNHVGTYLFTRLLLPLLREHADKGRVVTVASKAHFQAKSIDWDATRQPTKTITGLTEYERSKLCNVLFAKQLATREPTICSVSLHPGVVASDIWRRIPWPIRPIYKRFMITNEEGAATSIHCATDEGVLAHDGAYFDQCAPVKPSALALDAALAENVWTQTEEYVRQWLPNA
jgi:NAD(P)-dependent dehydrogenase (short-subunit alcohol dehydrogenase family)